MFLASHSFLDKDCCPLNLTVIAYSLISVKHFMQTGENMALPSVDSEAIELALVEFDTSLRSSVEWVNWESNRYGKRYEPEILLGALTGLAYVA